MRATSSDVRRRRKTAGDESACAKKSLDIEYRIRYSFVNSDIWPIIQTGRKKLEELDNGRNKHYVEYCIRSGWAATRRAKTKWANLFCDQIVDFLVSPKHFKPSDLE